MAQRGSGFKVPAPKPDTYLFTKLWEREVQSRLAGQPLPKKIPSDVFEEAKTATEQILGFSLEEAERKENEQRLLEDLRWEAKHAKSGAEELEDDSPVSVM